MKAKFFLPLIAGVVAIGYFVIQQQAASISPEAAFDATAVSELIPERVEQMEIVPDATYAGLMEQAGIAADISAAIYDASQDVYDLANIRLGRTLDLYFATTTDELRELVYQIDSEEELHVVRAHVERTELPADGASTTPRVATVDIWQAAAVPINYDVAIATDEGVIDSSMYQAALDNGIDIRAIIELANAFQWTIDFALDPRVGDTFRFVYEKRFRDGEYVGPGRILAGRYVNDGTPYEVFYFEESEENSGYFDADGNSVQKLFLKAPVAFKYISSGFTTGKRYVQAFDVSTGHRAIDYAATLGTPIRAVGDGTVVSAGWSSQGYGNLTSIRHNATYTTNYAHQSRIIVKAGQKVSQGQTIGYVGSTGFSTGPHLHFEMVKNGVKINPLKEILPPGKAIAQENRQRFLDQITPLRQQLAE